jgi:hypothetical protein
MFIRCLPLKSASFSQYAMSPAEVQPSAMNGWSKFEWTSARVRAEMILRDLLFRSERNSSQSTEQFLNTLRLRRTDVRRAEIVSHDDRLMISAAPVPTPAPTWNVRAAVAAALEPPFKQMVPDASEVVHSPIDPKGVSVLKQPGEDGALKSTSHELVFIDTGAANYQQLLDDLWCHQDPNRHLDVVLLSPCKDGLSQITETVAQYQTVKLDAVHFVIQGTDRAIQLGSTWLDNTSLHANRDRIASWRAALNPGADLLIYGCDLAGNDLGLTLLNQLVELTGADFAASIDDSGSTLLGSNWELEYQRGNVETEVSFCGLLQPEWDSLLNAFTATNTSDLRSKSPTIADSLTFGGTTDTDFGLPGHSIIELIGPHAGIANAIPQAALGGLDPTKRSHQRAMRSAPSTREKPVHLAPSAMLTILPDPIQDLTKSILQYTEMWNQLNTFLDRLSEPGQASAHLSRRGKNARRLWSPSAAYVRIVGRKHGNRTPATPDRSVWLAS